MKRMAAVAALLFAGAALADTTPVMVSLVTPVQAPSRSYDVAGFRLSLLYGDCRDFKGLDVGVAQRAADGFSGVALGGLNIAGAQFYGVQAGFVNWNSHSAVDWRSRSVGIQFGAINYADSFCGLQDGALNVATGNFTGLQDGLVNFTCDLNGLQCGNWIVLGINIASGSVSGGQIGIVNYAQAMKKGVQIGIVNIIAENGWLPVLPILNGGF